MLLPDDDKQKLREAIKKIDDVIAAFDPAIGKIAKMLCTLGGISGEKIEIV